MNQTNIKPISRKTTFATEFLPRHVNCREFINPGLLARAFSPFDPDAGLLRAGREVLKSIAEFTKGRKDFAFETTLSGRSYVRVLRRVEQAGFGLYIVRQLIGSDPLDFEGRSGPDSHPRSRAVRTAAAGVFTMNRSSKSSLTQMATQALEEAVAKVIEEYRRRGIPLAVWRNGKAVLLPTSEAATLRESPPAYRTSSREK